jgi:hypothetical protein
MARRTNRYTRQRSEIEAALNRKAFRSRRRQPAFRRNKIAHISDGRTRENHLGVQARISFATRCAAKIREHQHGRFAAADNTNA